jgi:ABC-2 type transport system permease protein|nr:ABC transporter permease [Pseudoalteromonas sp. Ps84H-4]
MSIVTSLSRIKAIVSKELLQLRRDRMTFAMVVMIPLIQLILFGYAINTNVKDIPVAVVDHSKTALSRILVQTVSATNVVKVTDYYDSIEQAQTAIASAKVRAVFFIPHDVANRLAQHPTVGFGLPDGSNESLVRPIAHWLVDGSDTMVASSIKSLRNMPLAELLDKPANRTYPTFETTLFYNPEQRSAVNIVPGLAAVILTMTMIMFTSAAIVKEQERGNMELLITLPLSSLELMIGKVVPYIFIGFIQLFIILGMGKVLFHIPFGGGLVALVVATFAFICASLVLGLVLSTIAKNQLQAMQMTIFILLPSILLSGFVFPYEGMPKVAQWLAECLPATHYLRLIRGIVLKEVNLISMSNDLIWLSVFTILGLAVAAFRFKKTLD